MISIFKRILVNGHTKAELKRNRAGRFIDRPQDLPLGTEVAVFQKGTQGYWNNGDGWWERGNLCLLSDTDEIGICTGDGHFTLDQVEVYLIK